MKALSLLVASSPPPNDLVFSSTRVGLTRRGYCGLWPKTEKTTQTITTPTKPAVPSYHLSTHPHNSTTGLLPFLPPRQFPPRPAAFAGYCMLFLQMAIVNRPAFSRP